MNTFGWVVIVLLLFWLGALVGKAPAEVLYGWTLVGFVSSTIYHITHKV
jgi:hypothetical protein